MAIKDQNMIGILQVKYGFILLVYSFKNGTQYLIVIELYKEAISLHSTSFLISFFFPNPGSHISDRNSPFWMAGIALFSKATSVIIIL